MIDILCDRCGKSCQTGHGFEFATMHATWGFESVNKDEFQHFIVLCEKCYDETLKVMGIKPNARNYLTREIDPSGGRIESALRDLAEMKPRQPRRWNGSEWVQEEPK